MKDNRLSDRQWGPGRHGPGDNVSAYFTRAATEVPLEYAAEVLQVRRSSSRARPTYWKYAAAPLRRRRAINLPRIARALPRQRQWALPPTATQR